MNPSNLSSEPGLQSHRRIRTLVVDDSQLMREFMTILIGQVFGLELVGTAADGCQALRCVAALKPDVVLMDVDMPYLDGIEATRSIKQTGRQSSYAPAIIIVTSEDTLACRFRAEEAGADGFVAKAASLRVQLKSTLDCLFPANGESLPANPVEASHESCCS